MLVDLKKTYTLPTNKRALEDIFNNVILTFMREGLRRI